MQDCEHVQRRLNLLVATTVPDRRDMNDVIRRLGGSECSPDTPDAALAAFVTALLQAVWEND